MEKKKKEIRPVWSMDVMILSNINEISKAVSESAIQVETGNLNSIFVLRATLIELYDNMKSWLDDGDTIQKSFNKIDKKLMKSGFNLEEMNHNEFDQIKNSLNLIKRLLFEARNNLFMKFIVVRTEKERAEEYAFGRL